MFKYSFSEKQDKRREERRPKPYIKPFSKKTYNELTELKLWEGSTVTWGANAMAGTTGIKSMTKEDAIDKMNFVAKALRNGKYENEEVFDLLEIYFKQLQQTIQDISTTTTKPEELIVQQQSTLPEGISDVLTTFRKSLIIN